MSIEDIKRSWWGNSTVVPWKCPGCSAASPIADWRVVEPECEDCGSHDGRECPACGEVFDHVWGADKIARATPPDPTPDAGEITSFRRSI